MTNKLAMWQIVFNFPARTFTYFPSCWKLYCQRKISVYADERDLQINQQIFKDELILKLDTQSK